jgi:magnesium-protoporphyrin O-methyltransferase
MSTPPLSTWRLREARLNGEGWLGRLEYRYGDVVELAAELPPADIVTLDSVICCYPYLAGLLRAAVSRTPRVVGLTYPRDVWWMRAYMRLWNLSHAVRRSRARYFIHRHAEVNRLMAELGFVKAHDGGTREWRVVLYHHA